MFLILDQEATEFSLRIRDIAESKGLKTVFMTSAELASDLALVFQLSEQGPSLYLQYQEVAVETSDIEGVYCGINVFEPMLWRQFIPKDAEYAARETQALWLSILASLPCRVVNPPALDSLAGTLLSTPEVLYHAHRLGFSIPMVINLESGKIAAEVLGKTVPTHYADLGEVWTNETGLCLDDLSCLEQNENHFRVLEEVTGRPIYLTLLGNRFFACEKVSGDLVIPLTNRKIPRLIKTRLRTFHKQLNLTLAEYSFCVMADDTWVFVGCRRPPIYAVTAYGDTLIEQIIDYAVGRGKEKIM